MKFAAINLRDFHHNQDQGKAKTRAEIRIIGAKNMEGAKEHLRTFHGMNAWLLVRIDLTKNIAYATGQERMED